MLKTSSSTDLLTNTAQMMSLIMLDGIGGKSVEKLSKSCSKVKELSKIQIVSKA